MNGERIVETRTHCQAEASKAWRAENPGLPMTECPPDQREFVSYLVLVVTFPQVTEPDPRKWPQRIKPLRELYRAPEHEVFGDLPEAPSGLVVPA